jgi:non-specific serine/threonine protein kinase
MMIGQTLLNRYEVEAEAGKGGMGVVYKAHDNLLHRIVAIKFLNAAGLGTSGRARLLSEARATAQLNHPNIVSVFDAGEVNSEPFIVMEFLEGKTLRGHQTTSIIDSLTITVQICSALDHAHAKGVIHRDLKLENIIITESQVLKLMDFGLARTVDGERLTEEGALVGTFAYLAPELIQGQTANERSDLYALGVIMYEVFAGTSPFQGTVSAVIAQHLNGTVAPPSEHNPQIPAWADEIILRLLSKHPEDRPASAKEVLQVLKKADEVSAKLIAAHVPEITTRNNLPVQLTNFIGREKEIAETKQSIAEHRLVTLTGSGGTGKTRLSLQVAADLLDQFPGGIWFAELAPLTDPDLIPQAILSAAGMQPQSGKTTLQTLIDFLHEKTSLLVFDNCEHLIDSSARLAESILTGAPNVKILASSREALGVRGEQVLRVPSLTLPDIKHLPDVGQLSQYESVSLFVDRARPVQSDFTITDQNAQAIAQICHRLDGIPLAIELAAARIRMLNVEEIATRLNDRFRLLTGGSRTALPRQQTLRALIDWSYELLSNNEQALLRRLAVFSGGCTLQSAEQVCSDEEPAGISSYDMLDLLTRLVDKSLVALDKHPAQSRYRILETVRQYAREKLMETGQGEEIRKKHFDYFFKLATEVEPHIQYGPAQLTWLDKLEDELGNFYAALEWSLENGMESGAELIAKLWWFWDRRGHWLEGYEWTQRALELVSGKTSLRAKLLAEAGWLASELVYHQKSIAHAMESVALYRLLGDKAGLAVPLITLGDEFRDQADLVKSRQFYTESYTLFEETQNQWGLRYVLLNGFSTLANAEGKHEEVKNLLLQALAMSRKTEDKEGIGFSLLLLGHEEIKTHNYARAKDFYDESMRLARESRYPDMLVSCTRELGHLAYLTNDYEQAKNRFEELLQMNRDLGEKNGIAFALRRLGHLARIQRNYDHARKIYAEILSKAHEVEERRQIFGTMLEIAFLNERLGEFANSTRLFGAVETLYPVVYKGMADDIFTECERTKESCKNNLTDEPYKTTYAEGATMAFEQAVAFALNMLREPNQ